MQVNIETRKIGIFRQQIFGWWISGIGKERLRVNSAPDPDKFLDEFNDATRTKPTRHRAGNFIADEIAKDRWMPCVRPHCNANSFDDLSAGRSLTQKLYMFLPRQRDKHPHIDSSTMIEKPTRRRMINPHKIEASLPHERKIGSDLLRPAKILTFAVGLKGAVGNALHEKFSVALEKEFRSRTDARVYDRCHVERSRDISRRWVGFNQEIVSVRKAAPRSIGEADRWPNKLLRA